MNAIEIFTQNLPYNLATQIKDQYDDLLPIFKSYATSENKFYAQIADRYEISCFILGLAIFSKSVIIPLREATSSFKYLQSKENIQGIQIGKYLFSNNDAMGILNMYTDFHEILNKYNIPEQFLLFSDVKDFARNLNNYFDRMYA